ncbi:MAG: hypothetical protein LZF62_320145 [Nitrospira sp.]|nr:MAG: hypothetical protein LZF62_320145 [Nitrospira sp.]
MSAKHMESLVFVLLFSVVVIAGMSQGVRPSAPVRQVCHQRTLKLGDQGLTGIWGHLLSPWLEYATVRTRRQRTAPLRADRRNDSGRGRPLLYLK